MLQTFRPHLAQGILAGVIIFSFLPALCQSSGPETAVDHGLGATDVKSWWRGITTDGFLSFSYTYNTNVPATRINQFRVFDFNDDEPQLDVAQVVIQRAISEPRQFGFRFNLMAGSGVPEVTAAYGLFRDKDTGIAHHFDMPELFVSYVAPVGKGLRLDVGKYATNMGYEVIGGFDGYNDNFSRGFIFGYGIPFTHTGIRASYAFSSKVTAMAAVCNGWDDFEQRNRGYTGAGQLTLVPAKNMNVIFNFIAGPERLESQESGHDQRTVYEIVTTWKALSKMTVGGDGIYGHQENGVSVGHDAIWKGLAGYAKYNFTSNFSLAFRGEVFNDAGGTRTGTNQTLQGFSVTPEYDMNAKFFGLNSHFRKANGKVAVRGEMRLDRSNQNVFFRGSSPTTDGQFTGAVNVIYCSEHYQPTREHGVGALMAGNAR